jgi:membrane protein DedA with SNARE-associated domain
MALLELGDSLSAVFSEFSYLAPFGVLLLCGIGAPIPEEVTLIGAGILYHRGNVEFVPIVLVCISAILLGDSLPFWLGRRYGERALRVPWVARVLHPERFARLQKRFAEHGNWATFACRFFAGVRIPGYFLAGTMHMRWSRFLLLDLIGALVSVPTSIWLGKLFGDSMDTLKAKVHDMHLILGFLALSLVLVLLMYRRRKSATAPAAQRAEPPAAPPFEPPAGP